MGILNQIMVSCGIPGCSKKDEVMTYEALISVHIKECIKKECQCPNGCGEILNLGITDSHLTTCSKLLI